MNLTRLALLAEPGRWRLVTVLAERPRSVGVAARLAGLRQPQATKHLQALARAGMVTVHRSAQRRIYALESQPLRDLARELTEVADRTDAHRSNRLTLDHYAASVAEAAVVADRDNWADDREFSFERRIEAPRSEVWRHLTDAALMARWWAPDDLRISELSFSPRPGARLVQEYRLVDDPDAADHVVGRAEGVMESVSEPERLTFRLSPLLPDGRAGFTGHHQVTLLAHDATTIVQVSLQIRDSRPEAAAFVAGIEIGWNQALDRLVTATSRR